jgi:hypothetical protein
MIVREEDIPGMGIGVEESVHKNLLQVVSNCQVFKDRWTPSLVAPKSRSPRNWLGFGSA